MNGSARPGGDDGDPETRAAFLMLIFALSPDLSSAATNLLRKGLMVSGTRGLEANCGPDCLSLLCLPLLGCDLIQNRKETMTLFFKKIIDECQNLSAVVTVLPASPLSRSASSSGIFTLLLRIISLSENNIKSVAQNLFSSGGLKYRESP